MPILRKAFGVLIAVAVPVFAAMAPAQEAYPSRPIKLVVPYPAGGSADVIARHLAQKLTGKLGQTVFVDNVSGANGSMGSAAVSRAAPDGYTLLMGSSGPLTINPSIYKSMPFNPVKDLSGVALVAQVPLVLVVRPEMKVNSLPELIAMAKANPGKLTFGSAGIGSTQHLGGELLKAAAKIDIRHIPYKGAAPALQDLLAGRIDFIIDNAPTVMAQITAGTLKPIAVTTPKRMASLPNIPTFQERGLEGYEVVSFFGVLGPAGLPKPVVTKLHDVLTQITREQSAREWLTARTYEPMEGTVQEFEARITSDIAKWTAVVKAANVQTND